MDFREELLKLKDEKYKLFSSKLTRTSYPMIGVRVPLVKKMAKDISGEIDFNYFYNIKKPFFEEIMLEGLLIGYLKDINEVLSKLKIFLPKIDDWSICDSVCANLKITKKYKSIMWDFVTSYKDSCSEFELRFMLIIMLDYYLDKEYIYHILNIIENINSNKYYVKMAIAWLLATSIVKCEDETLSYIDKCNLDKFTFNKMISKCNESYRVRDDLKLFLNEKKKQQN